MVFRSSTMFGLVLSVCGYTPGNVSDAWNNHAVAFGANNVDKIMLDYDDNSILEVYDAGKDVLQTYDTLIEIKGFFEGAFEGLGNPNPFGLLATPVVEEPSSSMPFGQVFLLWKSPNSNVKFPAVTDTFVFDPNNFKIIRQNVVVFSDMNCPVTKAKPKEPVATTGAVQAGWDNHFAAFGGKNLTRIMLDYTDDSQAMFFDVKSAGTISVVSGTGPIKSMFTGLFADLADGTDLQVPYVATSKFSSIGAAGNDLGMTFLIWRSPTDKYAYVTDTFVYNSNGKIIRQNIVAVKTESSCAAITDVTKNTTSNNSTETDSDSSCQMAARSLVFLFLAVVLYER